MTPDLPIGSRVRISKLRDPEPLDWELAMEGTTGTIINIDSTPRDPEPLYTVETADNFGPFWADELELQAP